MNSSGFSLKPKRKIICWLNNEKLLNFLKSKLLLASLKFPMITDVIGIFSNALIIIQEQNKNSEIHRITYDAGLPRSDL